MKNVKTNGLFLAAFAVLVLAALGGIWWGVSEIFVTLTGDELRGDANATLFVVALFFFIIALLHADDKRTALLSQVLTGLFVTLGAIIFVANAAFDSVGKNLAETPEAVAWAIPMTWTLPVLIGLLGFVLMSLDKYFGTDKQPILGASNSGVVNMLYHGLYNVLIVSALVSSAFGTYEVMYGVTHSFWHAMIYVGTVELAIYVFASFTHRTKDQEVFWYTFGLTIFAFAVANVFQIVSAIDKLSGGINTQDTAAAFARNFVLLPPILMGAIAGGLYMFNQRKVYVPFKEGNKEGKSGGQESGRSERGGDNRPSRQEYDFRNNEQRREERGGDAPLRMPQGQGQGRRQQGQGGGRDQSESRGSDNRPSGNKSQGIQHGTERFTEPEGLEEESVAALKKLGWSGNRISKMSQAEADDKIAKGERPFVVTEQHKSALRELGYSDKLISQMNPKEVENRVANKVRYREPQTVGQSKNGASGNSQNFK